MWRITLALVNSDIDKQYSLPNTAIHSGPFEDLGRDEIDEARVGAPLNKSQPRLDVSYFFLRRLCISYLT